VNDRDALYSAILKHPDEDTPRLAFADWLEENGETDHAAFIRRQIELARVPEWDPLWVRTKFLDPGTIGGRTRATPEAPDPISWEKGGDEWSGPFRRGFPAAFEVFRGAPFHAELAKLVRIAPVDRVSWYASDARNAPPSWNALVNDPVFAHIRHFDPALMALTERNIRTLHDSPHAAGLSDLNLITCDLTPALTARFLRLPRFRRLRRLALGIPGARLGGIVRAADEFENHCLCALHVRCNQTLARRSLLYDSGLLHSPLFRGLKELNLMENPFGPEGPHQLIRSPALIGLECLRLSWCKGGDDLAAALAGCSELAHLRSLDLYSNRIGPKGVRALAESPYLANLRVLDLSSNPVGDDGARALFRSPHLTNLLHLALHDCGITDASAQAILDSPLADPLVRLELHWWETGNDRMRLGEPMVLRLRERFGNRLVLETEEPAPLA
jgi:uncharacterized protein (TIGR02996 family)